MASHKARNGEINDIAEHATEKLKVQLQMIGRC